MSEEMEGEMYDYIERQCEILNNRLKRKFDASAICLMITDPKHSDIEAYKMADEEITDLLSDIDFEGIMVDRNSDSTIKFVPFSTIMEDGDDGPSPEDVVCELTDEGDIVCDTRDWERYIR